MNLHDRLNHSEQIMLLIAKGNFVAGTHSSWGAKIITTTITTAIMKPEQAHKTDLHGENCGKEWDSGDLRNTV